MKNWAILNIIFISVIFTLCLSTSELEILDGPPDLEDLHEESPTREELEETFSIMPDIETGERLTILPVYFIPKDASLSDEDLARANELLDAHLDLARQHYDLLLKDTFLISEPAVYHARHEDAYYSDIPEGEADSAHRIVKELFEWEGDNRVDSSTVYLTLYVRPRDRQYGEGMQWYGGARTFNGPPNSGGGYIEMEYTSLINDNPYPFQSTLVHEVGHAFGLTHVSVYGHDDATSGSIMSLNPAHHSRGLNQSRQPGGFCPEDYYLLSLNKRAFPGFTFIPAVHNPDGRDLVLQYNLGAMDPYIGEIERMPGVGYELFYDGQLVSGAEAHYYTFYQAEANCNWNIENQKGVLVQCRYNGESFYDNKTI